MDRMINILVRGNYLTKDNKIAGVQHEGNVTALRITFDEGWDGYAKKVTFWDALDSNPVERILTADLLEDMTESNRIYLCLIPPEPLAEAGECKFTIDGYLEGKRQRSLETCLEVLEADFIEEAGEPTDPTPSQAEQLQVQIDTILQDMSAEADRAETAAEGAEIAQQAAETAQGKAEDAQSASEAAQVKSEAAQSKAEDAQQAAETAQAKSETAQRAAEKARDEAMDIAGGDFATKDELEAAIANIPTESDVFIATYGTTTSAEIEAAYQAGKWIFVNANGMIGSLMRRSSATSFTFVCGANRYDCVSDAWSSQQALAAASHAAKHATGGTDPITPESIGAKPAGESDVFIAEYGVSTSAEIDAAYLAGKIVLCKYTGGKQYGVLYRRTNATNHQFLSGANVWTCFDGTWYDNPMLATSAALAAKAPMYTYGTTDLTAGSSPLETGKLYFVYE